MAMVLGNFHCMGVLVIWVLVKQGATVIEEGAGGEGPFHSPIFQTA